MVERSRASKISDSGCPTLDGAIGAYVPPITHPEHSAGVLLLVHGATLNSCMWDPVRRHLDSSYAVVAPDLPGHGTRKGDRFSIEAAIATVVDAAAVVAPTKLILVGDSLGAYSSIAAASSLPQAHLKGLLLAGSTFEFTGNARAFPAILRGVLFNGLTALLGEERLLNTFMPKALGPAGFDLSPEDANAIVARGTSVKVFSQAVKALRGVDFRAKLSDIEQPLLIVNGDLDGLNLRQEAEFIRVAKHATTHRFLNTKHGVSLWRPREFAALINDFAGQMLT